MSKPLVISADSTVDLSRDLIERYQIRIIPLTITLGEESFLDGQGFTPLELYARFRKDGTLPKRQHGGAITSKGFRLHFCPECGRRIQGRGKR